MFFSFTIVISGAFLEKPTPNKQGSTYQIKCDSDGLLRGNIKGSDLHHGVELSFRNNDFNEMIRFICSDPSEFDDRDVDQFNIAYEQAQRLGAIPIVKNYEIILKDQAYYGSWESFLLMLILGILGVFIVGWIIQSSFFYVVIGQKPQIPFKRFFKKIINDH